MVVRQGFFHSSIVLQVFSRSYDPPSYTQKLNMVLNTCCFWGVQVIFIMHSKVKFSNLIFWDGVISFLTISILVSWFTCCQEQGILNPSISSLELSWYRFHLKPSLRNIVLWCLSMIQVFNYPLGESSFHLFVDLKQAIVSVSGRLSPHNFEMFSISPLQAYSFRCWFPTPPL